MTCIMHNACSNYAKTKKATSCTKKCNVFAHIYVYKGYGSYSGYRKYDDIQIRFLLFTYAEQLQHTTPCTKKPVKTYCHGNMNVLAMILFTHLCL